VRDAIRRGAAENEVQKHEEKLTGAWRQMSALRRRYKKWFKGDGKEDCTHKQRYEASYQSKNTTKCAKIRHIYLEIQDLSIYKMIHDILEIQDLKFLHAFK